MPRPSVTGQANNAAAAAFSLTLPTHKLNDLILVGIETANEAVPATAFTANGYTEVTGAGGPPVGQGTAAGSNATRLTLYWRRAANNTMPPVYVADSGDHQAAFAAIITNANTTVDPPWEISANIRQTTNTTTLNFNSLTTTNANTLIVHVAGVDTDSTSAQVSGPTNASLSNLTEHTDIFTNAQDGGGIVFISGGKAVAGSTGNTTATLATTEIFNSWTAAILGTPDPTFKPRSYITLI